jgi:hypothetical protein
MNAEAYRELLSPQAYEVLSELKFQYYGHCFIDRLAYNLAIPVPSVRRSIAELRFYGFDIELTNGMVTLHREKKGMLRG